MRKLRNRQIECQVIFQYLSQLMSRAKQLLLSGLIFTFTCSSVYAVPLFEQLPVATPAPLPSGPIALGFPAIADNFELGADALVDEITFWTVEGPANTVPPDPANPNPYPFPLESIAFELAIFADDGFGLPDVLAPLYTESITIVDVVTSGGPVLEHTYGFASPFALMGGTSYFLQVAAGITNPGLLGWQMSDPLAGLPPYTIEPGPTGEPIASEVEPAANMAFLLSGSPTGAVPLPASIFLMVPGLWMLFRKKHS